MNFIKNNILFTLILDICLLSCHSNQNITINDLRIYLERIQQDNKSHSTIDFNSKLDIKDLNIFQDSDKQPITQQNINSSLTGIIQIGKKKFALLQEKNQSFITENGDNIHQGKINNISSEKVCIKQTFGLHNNNTCFTLHQK